MATVSGKQLDDLKKLYYEAFMSIPAIAGRLGLSVDALYYAMRKNGWERRGGAACNHLQFLNKPASFTIPERLSTDQQELKTVAISLYWGEGAKLGHSVDFANSDVAMCKIFLRFLREVCHVDEKRLRGFIYCHENQDPRFLISFWSSALRLPREQFTKPYVRRMDAAASSCKRPSRMLYGLVHIRYADMKLHQQLLRWIEEYKNYWAGSEAVKRTTL